MDNSLVNYVTGSVVPAVRDRAVARKAKDIYDEVRLAGMKADGAMALAGHIMEGFNTLDSRRRALSNGDPMNDIMLSEIQACAMLKIKQIQLNLYSQWDL
jgi:hypothetical protein